MRVATPDGVEFSPSVSVADRSVLLVDDEQHVLQKLAEWLDAVNYRPVCAGSVSEALRASRDPSLHFAIIDLQLDGRFDGVRLGYVLRRRFGLPFVLISGYLTTPRVVEAVRLGALDVLDKPIDRETLVGVVQSIDVAPTALRHAKGTRFGRSAGIVHTAPIRRWSWMILKACDAPHDLRTIAEWAAFIGCSQGTIDETCRLCGVTARDSRDLARFLRALARCRSTGAVLGTHFSVADERTLQHLFERANMQPSARRVDLRVFLLKQTFVPTSKQCLRDLAHLAANSPYFF